MTDLKPPTIMVVDDTAENLRLLERLLSEREYRVLTFPNGRLALAAAKRQPPDMILLDINMPEMDGFEACQRLKADPDTRDIPVLFISALADLANKVRALEEGGQDFITKPFQMEEVHARIETHLRLRKLQQTLEAQNQTLRDLEMHRDLLAHMIIHDMRSTLQALVSHFDLLDHLEGASLSATGSAHLRRIRETVKRLGRMTNDVLDVKRIETSALVLCREDCRLTDLFSEVLEEVEALAGRRRLSQRVEPQTLAVSADRGLMRRLLLNLVGNAMKFTPDAEGRIQLQASEVEGRVRIEVCDNGPGVPSEHREKIFDKFWQAEIGRRHERHSTGLGLTFCKLVAEEHGGTIQVAESPDCGCVIRLELSPPPDSERIQPSA